MILEHPCENTTTMVLLFFLCIREKKEEYFLVKKTHKTQIYPEIVISLVLRSLFKFSKWDVSTPLNNTKKGNSFIHFLFIN